MKTPLTGIVVPIITPLRDRDSLDIPGLERHLERLLAGGVSGFFVLGTSGEGPSLGYRLRRELVSQVISINRGRVPVLVCITDTAFAESVNVARHAADAGADAVVLAPPYYLPPSEAELNEYLEHILPELPLPLFLYNMPALTKVHFTPATIRRAMEQPKIIGLKDSSGDFEAFRKFAALLPARPDWSLLIGPEELLAEAVGVGAHGGVCGGANVFPRLYVELCKAAQAGNAARVQDLQKAVQQVVGTLYRIGHHPSAIIKGLKCALSCLGVCDDFMAEPFHRFRALERGAVEKFVAEFVPLLKSLGV